MPKMLLVDHLLLHCQLLVSLWRVIKTAFGVSGTSTFSVILMGEIGVGTRFISVTGLYGT